MYSKKLSHITPIRGVNDDGLGKKHALSKLIRAVDSEFVWLHDDDVVLPAVIQRDAPLLEIDDTADLIILPLRMHSRNDRPSLIERLQIAEYQAIQNLTVSTAKNGHSIMCSGANLIVRRQAWLACEPELHPEIPSGDDMFLLEAMKRHGRTIRVLDHPDYTAVVRPVGTWKALWRQRTRWAGKAPHYTDRDIRHYGALTLILMTLQLLCPLFFVLYLPFECHLIYGKNEQKNQQYDFWDILLLSVLYPYYALACTIGGIMAKGEW